MPPARRVLDTTPIGNTILSWSVLAVVLLAATATGDDATDEVVLRSTSGGRLIQKGTIRDFTGRELTFLPQGGSEPRTYPRDEVISVKTPRRSHHAAGVAAFEEGDYFTAARELEAAVDAEPRKWVRRDILGLLVRCALARGDGRSARLRFRLLTEGEPNHRHRYLLPLAWTPTEVGPATAAEGRTLLVHDDESMRLIGASLLLEHEPNAAEAERVLRGLATSSDELIRRLAVAQQWRLRLGRALTEGELERWENEVERLPARARGGPRYLVGRGFAQLGVHDRAAVAFLWAPLVADHDHHLSARSMIAAGDALRRIGQDNRAFGLYREVVARYGHTPFAEDARAAIGELNEAQ